MFWCVTNKIICSSLIAKEDGIPIRFRMAMAHLEDGAFLLEVTENIRRVYFGEYGLYNIQIHG